MMFEELFENVEMDEYGMMLIMELIYQMQLEEEQ